MTERRVGLREAKDVPVVDRHARRASLPVDDTSCVVCGSGALFERKCKVLCGNCGTILRSCSDL